MSKFKGGLDAYKQRQAEVQPEPIQTVNNTPPQASDISTTSSPINSSLKKSKELQQVNSYVPKQLYKKVKIALVEEERTISDLITQLLSDWVNQKNK